MGWKGRGGREGCMGWNCLGFGGGWWVLHVCIVGAKLLELGHVLVVRYAEASLENGHEYSK